MKIKTCFLVASLLLGGSLFALAENAESIQITAPPALPRGFALRGYSPLVRVHYADLKAESYTLKVWLLEDKNYQTASTQWSERIVPVDNAKGGVSNGQLLLNVNMDVYNLDVKMDKCKT